MERERECGGGGGRGGTTPGYNSPQEDQYKLLSQTVSVVSWGLDTTCPLLLSLLSTCWQRPFDLAGSL